MSKHFEAAFARTIGHEGGFSDDPVDRGGKTRFGITETVARAYGYAGAMDKLPFAIAKAIYRERYWDYLSLDAVASLYPALAYKLFDAGVNCGQANAVKWLQIGLNAFNNNGALYDDIGEDGGMGRLTLYALRSFHAHRGTEGGQALFEVVDSYQGVHYTNIARRDKTQEKYTFGWFMNRIGQWCGMKGAA